MIRLIFNPSRYLSETLRYRIMELGIKLDDHVASIECKLIALGEIDLVDEMIAEISAAIADRKAS